MPTELINLISNVGFPIAMCIYMIWYNKSTIDELRDTIDNNTKTVIELSTIVSKITSAGD